MVTCLIARNVNNLKYTGIFPSDEDEDDIDCQTLLSVKDDKSWLFFSFFFWRNSLQWVRASSFTTFLDHT